MDQLHVFIHLLFLSFIALFPVVNPIGTAFIVDPYLAPLDAPARRSAVRRIAVFAFGLCVVVLFGGHWILELFGLSVPVIQLAGGIMICKMGWDQLSSSTSGKPDANDGKAMSDHAPGKALDGLLFYPLTFPMTTGAGTISVLLTLSAHGSSADWSTYLVNTAAILSATIAMCILILFFYNNTRQLVDRLGRSGETVLSRISAFLVFCVGLQIAVSGIKGLLATGSL